MRIVRIMAIFFGCLAASSAIAGQGDHFKTDIRDAGRRALAHSALKRRRGGKVAASHGALKRVDREDRKKGYFRIPASKTTKRTSSKAGTKPLAAPTRNAGFKRPVSDGSYKPPTTAAQKVP